MPWMLDHSGDPDAHSRFWADVATDRARVRVFDADPGLLDGVPEAVATPLRHRVVVPRVWVGCGPWTPQRPAAARGEVLGLLVLEGLVERSVVVADRRASELLGPGDVLRPWDPRYGVETSWCVLHLTQLAVLDDHVASAAARSPQVVSNLMGRSTDRLDDLARRLAIGQLRSAEDRVLLVLTALADRWGRVTPDGVHLPFTLNHATISRLGCLARPTASAALSALQRAGRLVRCVDGTWLVVPDDLAEPAPACGAQGSTSPRRIA